MEGFSKDINELCLVLFSSVTQSCNYFVPLLFFMRLGFGAFLGISSSDVGKLLKGVILYFLLIISFQYVLDFLFLIPESVKLEMSFEKKEIQRDLELNREIKEENQYTPSFLRDFIESFISFLFYVTRFIYFLFLMLLSSLAPIVFLLSTMLGIGMGIQIFFGLLVSAASWPIVWQGFDTLTVWVSGKDVSEYGAYSYEVISYFMKIVGPLGLAYTALNSGPGKNLMDGISKTVSMLKPTSFGALKLASQGSIAGIGGYKGAKEGINRARSKNRSIDYSNRNQSKKERIVVAGARGAVSGARKALVETRIKNRPYNQKGTEQ